MYAISKHALSKARKERFIGTINVTLGTINQVIALAISKDLLMKFKTHQSKECVYFQPLLGRTFQHMPALSTQGEGDIIHVHLRSSRAH